MAQVVSRRPLTAEVRVRALSIHVGFVVDNVAVVQAFLRVLTFSLPISFHRGFPCSYIIRGMNGRPVGGRSLETSRPIDMNNNLNFIQLVYFPNILCKPPQKYFIQAFLRYFISSRLKGYTSRKFTK
jgi:hypothetical protein